MKIKAKHKKMSFLSNERLSNGSDCRFEVLASQETPAESGPELKHPEVLEKDEKILVKGAKQKRI